MVEPGRDLLLGRATQSLAPDDFTSFPDLDDVTERLMSFQDRYNATARPFDWTFTRNDLNRLLTRIGRHDCHTPQPLTA
jgi:hypothetical protein